MWSWSDESTAKRKAKTVGHSQKFDYNASYNVNSGPTTSLQRLGASRGLPLGYYTTRQVTPPAHSPVQFPLPQQQNEGFYYGYSQAMQSSYPTYPQKIPRFSPYNSNPVQNGYYDKGYNTYSSDSTSKSPPAVSVLQQPKKYKKQNKNSPVKKKIDKKSKKDGDQSLNASFGNYKPKAVSGNNKAFSLAEDGNFNFVDVGESVLGETSDTHLSDFEEYIFEGKDKFNSVKSNKSGNSSVRFKETPLRIQVPDYLGDSFGTEKSDKLAGIHQGSSPVQEYSTANDYNNQSPVYTTVNKEHKKTKFPVPKKSRKDEEPVYSTIGEKSIGKIELNRQSQNKEKSLQKPLSVLEELKQRISKHQNSVSVENENSDSNGINSNNVVLSGSVRSKAEDNFEPWNEVAPPPPAPPPPPPLPGIAKQSSHTTEIQGIDNINTPVPGFVQTPPPSPPARKQGYHKDSLQINGNESSNAKTLQNNTLEVQFQTIENTENESIDWINEEDTNSAVVSSTVQENTPKFDNKRDYQPLIKEKIQDNDKSTAPEMSSNATATVTSDSSSEDVSSSDEDSESTDQDNEDDDDTTRPKSILKNKHEKSLINPDHISMSDLDNEDDAKDQSSNDGEQESVHGKDEETIGTGVVFTKDTIDNEGKGKQYQQEGINISDIYVGKISSKNAIAKPNPIYRESDHENLVTDKNSENTSTSNDVTTTALSNSSFTAENDQDLHIYDEPRSIIHSVDEGPPPPKSTSKKRKNSPKSKERKKIPKSILKNKPAKLSINGSIPHQESQGNVNYTIPKSPTLSGKSTQSNEMFYSLKKTQDNISVIKIKIDNDGQDEEPFVDNFTLLRTARYDDSLPRTPTTLNNTNNNYSFSVNTLQRQISLGADSVDNVTPIVYTPASQTPGWTNQVVFTYPSTKGDTKRKKEKKYKKHGQKEDKKEKGENIPEVVINNHLDPQEKKTTFADQGLGFEAQIMRAKRRQRNKKICRLASFVLVILLIVIGAIIAVYFLVRRDDAEIAVMTTTTAASNN